MTEAALVDRLRALPASERRAIYARFTGAELASLEFAFRAFWARPDQLPPAQGFRIWACTGGRGAGKTKAAAEWVRERVRLGRARRVHFIAATIDDARATMVDGASGILAVSPPDERPEFLPSVAGGSLVWPNGAVGTIFSAERPARLRGHQCDTLWADDVAAWGPKTPDTWNMAMFGFRIGRPQCVVSTTPAAIDLLVALLKGDKRGVVVTRASSHANKGNLAPEFLEETIAEFEGTDLGLQEIDGIMAAPNRQSPFFGIDLGATRVREAPPLSRIVVALDPAMSAAKRADETGITVAGLGYDGHVYILEDLSGHHAAETWGDLVISAYDRHQADAIVGEVNRGNDLIGANVRAALFRKRRSSAARIDFREVSAKRGKVIRWGPVRTLYASGRVHHVGALALLETQMRNWDPANVNSPDDRIDAVVHACYELAHLDAEYVDPRAGFEGLEELNNTPNPLGFAVGDDFGGRPDAGHRWL